MSSRAIRRPRHVELDITMGHPNYAGKLEQMERSEVYTAVRSLLQQVGGDLMLLSDNAEDHLLQLRFGSCTVSINGTLEYLHECHDTLPNKVRAQTMLRAVHALNWAVEAVEASPVLPVTCPAACAVVTRASFECEKLIDPDMPPR